MMWSDLAAIAFMASTCALGCAVGAVVELFRKPQDLSWRKEPTIGDVRNLKIPTVDHLGRREPTLSATLEKP